MARKSKQDGGLWHEPADPNDRAKRLHAVVDSLHVSTEARRRRTLRHLRMYEGRWLPDLTPTAYFDGPTRAAGPAPQVVQLPRAIVDTACAKIAGKQKPKAMFAVSNGDWATKRKAKRMERGVEAVMSQRHGLQHDAWGVHLEAFRDTGYADCGAVKWEPDFDEGRITCRRLLPWEVIVDPRECRDGSMPLNWFHRYGYDRFKLAAQYPKFEDVIMAAPAMPDVYAASTRSSENDRHGRMVLVEEGWRVAISKDLPGVHTIAVGGVDLTEGEEWEWTFAPIELVTWAPWRMGIFGTSLIEIVAGLCDEVDNQLERWRMNEKLGNNLIGQCEDNSVREEDIRSNKAMTWIRRKPGTAPVEITTPNTFGPASIQYLDRIWRAVFDVPGISQADAQSEREPGLQSGEAQRIVANIKSERFSVQWQAYERMVAIGGARQILRCMKQLSDAGVKNVVIRSAKGGDMQEFSAKDFDLEIPDESIQIAAVSGLVNSPADRIDVAERLFGMGILSAAGVRRVIQAQDLDRELSSEDAQSRLIEKYIQSWLDPVTKADQKKFEYRPPKKWFDLGEAIVQVGRAMFEAEADNAPEWNLQWFVRFLEDCDRVMDQIAARKAEMQAAAGGNTAAVQALGPTAPGGGPPPPAGPPGPPGPNGPPPQMNGAAPPRPPMAA